MSLLCKLVKYNLKILEDIKNLYLYDFGIFIEMTPDEEEKAMLEQNIQMALSKKILDLEDAIDIREIKNLKMANQLLKVKRKQTDKNSNATTSSKATRAMQMQQQQAAMQSQQAALKLTCKKLQMKTQSKMQVKTS